MNNEEQVTGRIGYSKNSEHLYLTYKKMQAKATLILVMCIPVMYGTFEYASQDSLGEERLFFVIMFLLSLFVAYICIASILNKTLIVVTKDKLEVTNGPIPWPNSIKINVSKIHGLLIKPKLYSLSFGPSSEEVFDIYFVDKRNKEYLLVNRIINKEEAIMILSQVAQFLDVEDAAKYIGI